MSDSVREAKSNSALDEARKTVSDHLRRKREAKARKDAEKKVFWEEYHEQLAKSVPNQGGAKRKSPKRIRVWKLM